MKPFAAPHDPSVETTEPLGAAVGADADTDTDAEVEALVEAADDDTATDAEDDTPAEAALPHLPNPAWQPVPQCPSVLPQ